MKLILSHPTGNSFVRAAVTSFQKEGMLDEFHTTIASFEGSFLDQLGGTRMFSEIRRRRYDTSLRNITRQRPWREAGRLLAARAGLEKFVAHEKGSFCVDAVYQDLDRRVANSLSKGKYKKVEAVYAYEDGAALSFEIAKRNAMRCIYDLPIGYWRAARHYLEYERERRPQWSSTLTGLQDSMEKLQRKDRELDMADLIIVASSFTRETLKFFPGKLAPVAVVPYAFPPVGERKTYSPLRNRKLKLLFVGGLSQRKGIAELFEAVAALAPHVELTIVGYKVVQHCAALNKALQNHTWYPSLPHQEILQLMKASDVLLFPSLFEGFGLVITEAMSQGTPVITTDRTAGPDIIIHGENGWIAEAGSTSSLQAAIEEILLKPGIMRTAGESALETAARRPWSVYEKDLVAAVQELEQVLQ
ncbi:glycosyltransferase family 4 protein [Salinimicrobium sp. GXAS 041]|uniref:glycosyltransferase family 4 protein n=1 Tax=Salinimicrobium sp. GXAS 041 TaxID=3400806 RepID=UPI003C76AA58